jgi:hypothetical protein
MGRKNKNSSKFRGLPTSQGEIRETSDCPLSELDAVFVAFEKRYGLTSNNTRHLALAERIYQICLAYHEKECQKIMAYDNIETLRHLTHASLSPSVSYHDMIENKIIALVNPSGTYSNSYSELYRIACQGLGEITNFSNEVDRVGLKSLEDGKAVIKKIVAMSCDFLDALEPFPSELHESHEKVAINLDDIPF